MKLTIFTLFFLAATLSQAQYYEVTEVSFKNDELLEKYFKENLQKRVQWQGVWRMQMEQELKSYVIKLEKQDDELLVWLEMGDRKREPMTFVRLGQSAIFETQTPDSFLRIKLDEENPVMITGEYMALEAPESGETDDYKKLKKKYGENIEAFVIQSTLAEKDLNEEILSVEKAYKVTDVELLLNEDVVSFGEKYRDHFSSYTQDNLSTVKRAYLNKEFKTNIQGKKINISSINSGVSLFGSSSIEPIKDDVYRAQVLKSFWDFHLKDTEGFVLEKLEYSEFLVITKEDKNLPEYEKLKAKYGEKLPYQTIVQFVEEVPLEK